jgi:hypothetical protein
MKQAGKILLLSGLMLAALPLVADPVAEDSAVSEMAKVVTQAGRPGDCLAALAVNKIDGELRVVPAQGFLIEVGAHTINGRATLDTRKCRPIAADQQIASAADLEVNFEAGRTYYIAYDHKSQNTEEWRLVVWKVEFDNPSQTFIQ